MSSIRGWRRTNRGYDWEEQETLISMTQSDGYSGLPGCDSVSLVPDVSKEPRATIWKCKKSLSFGIDPRRWQHWYLSTRRELPSQRHSAIAENTLKSLSISFGDAMCEFLSLHSVHTGSSPSPSWGQLVAREFQGLKGLKVVATSHLHTVECAAVSNSRLFGRSYFVKHKTKFTFLSINIHNIEKNTWNKIITKKSLFALSFFITIYVLWEKKT